MEDKKNKEKRHIRFRLMYRFFIQIKVFCRFLCSAYSCKFLSVNKNGIRFLL